MKIGLIISSVFFCFLVNEALHSETYFSQTKKSLQTSIADGKEIYVDFCMQCHLGTGKGSETVPPLAGSDWLINKRKESIHAVKFGQTGPIKVNGKNYNGTMSPLGLTDEEIADVMNYVMHSWGNKQKVQVTEAEVAGVKK